MRGSPRNRSAGKEAEVILKRNHLLPFPPIVTNEPLYLLNRCNVYVYAIKGQAGYLVTNSIANIFPTKAAYV